MIVARPWLRLGIVVSSLVAACKFTHGELQPTMGDGGSDGPKLCSEQSITCDADTLRVCSGAGAIASDTQCGWGCIASPTPRCGQLVPSGSGGVASDGVMPADVTGEGLGDIVLPGGVTIDSDFGNIGLDGGDQNFYHFNAVGVDKGIDFQHRGAIRMWRFKSLRITGTVTLVGAYPIALVADGAIEIAGVIDARGVCSAAIAGPGGFNGGNTQGGSGLSPVGAMGGGEGATGTSAGGGGGGYGGNGGAALSNGGGVPFGDAEIAKLLGGGGGGAGFGGGFGRGGGGGGALQLISNRRIVIMSGGLNAGGCGGKKVTGNDSGGGGGAGGALLLEAPRVLIAGALAVNGGGGGGGGGPTSTPGGNGSLDRTVAAAGTGAAMDEDGGSGAVGGTAAGSGEGGNNPGGGGGGVGRIRINTHLDLGLMLDASAVLSPSFGDPNTTCTRGSASVQ